MAKVKSSPFNEMVSRKDIFEAATKPTKCTPARVYAHEWRIKSPSGKPYEWGRCKYCRARRLFKTAWPMKLDWALIHRARKQEERRIIRREKRAAIKKGKSE